MLEYKKVKKEACVEKLKKAPVGLDQNSPRFSQEVMPNGEVRIRLIFPDGTGYICTKSAGDGAWQNAHSHRGVTEVYAVQSGWAAFAWIDAKEHKCVRVCFPGDTFVAGPNQVHNVYLNGTIHTMKCGAPIGNPEKGAADWWPAQTGFDEWSKALTRQHMANQGELSGERRKTVFPG